MRGAIASATAAWAILLDRSAIIGKCPNTRRGRGRPRHIVGRASSPVRLPKNGLEIGQTPAAGGIRPYRSDPVDRLSDRLTLLIRAGTPIAVTSSGISRTTTDPAPTIARLPIR